MVSSSRSSVNIVAETFVGAARADRGRLTELGSKVVCHLCGNPYVLQEMPDGLHEELQGHTDTYMTTSRRAFLACLPMFPVAVSIATLPVAPKRRGINLNTIYKRLTVDDELSLVLQKAAKSLEAFTEQCHSLGGASCEWVVDVTRVGDAYQRFDVIRPQRRTRR
jgi:hypothetical protein